MFSLLNKIRFIVAFAFFIFMIQYTTSSPLENDNLLAQLIERLDRMQTKMDAMRSREVENAQLTERLDRRQTKMDAENDKWTRKLSFLEAEIEKLKKEKLQQDEKLQQLESQISHQKLSLSRTKRDDEESSEVLSSPPTSCQELKNQNGKIWPMDGIHLLKKRNKIKAALCTFPDDGSPVSEKVIGQVDVKTHPVHFYVQRDSNFNESFAIITFDVSRINKGNAFNESSGIFTTPVPGIYHFEFSAVKEYDAQYLTIDLQLNGKDVGVAATYPSAKGNWDVVSLSASFRLAAGDTVNLFNTAYGALLDGENRHFTHFTGWLIEEDLM